MAATAPSITALFPAAPARAALHAALKESLDALKAQPAYTWEAVKEATKPTADLCRERLKGAWRRRRRRRRRRGCPRLHSLRPFSPPSPPLSAQP